MKPKFQFKTTSLESRVDNIVGLLSPAAAFNRLQARYQKQLFSYVAAYPNEGRRNSNSSGAGESPRSAREKLQLAWNALETVENVGLCQAIRDKLMNYTCGSLRYQARTGSKSVNNEYEAFMKEKSGKSFSVGRRFTMRRMGMLAVSGIAIKGDVGWNPVPTMDGLAFQGIEADRIGNPIETLATNKYIRGMFINEGTGEVTAYNLFKRDMGNGRYVHDKRIPAITEDGLPNFLFCHNPISYDSYRGVTLFKSAIDNATYLEQMRRYELQALLWAASQSGVFKTSSGMLPEGLPFQTNEARVDESGNLITSFTIQPNTVQAIGTAEDIALFQHDRPSPNVIAMYRNTVNDICVGTGLSFGFVYDMSGLSGPAVRGTSAQDARTIAAWQATIAEDLLEPSKMLLLMDAIDRRELPYHPKWNNGAFFFPAKTTIDVGRESTANINEYNAALTSGANIAAEAQEDIEEIQEQCGIEAANLVRIAVDQAKRINTENKWAEDDKRALSWREVLPMLKPGKNIVMSPEFEAARAGQLDKAAEDATKRAEDEASSGGADLQ